MSEIYRNGKQYGGGVPLPTGGSTGQALLKRSGTNFDIGWGNPNPEYPAGGTQGQVLTKHSSTDNDVEWADVDALPSGGTTGQFLKKKSNTDGDAEWGDVNALPSGGTTGQVLAKHSNTTGDVEWKDVSTGGGVVSGYYNSSDHKFYEESTYTMEITGDPEMLYVDIPNDLPYWFDGTNFNPLSTDITVDATISSTSENPVQNKVIKTALDGKADLVSGKVPASQLPSYVDDVIEGYYNDTDGKFYEESTYTTEITGESGKVYVSLDTNFEYRWSGSAFVRINEGVVLGETSTTAYRGDRGKTAYDDSQQNKTNIGTLSNLTTTEKSSLVGAINEVNSDKQEQFQFSTMPTATADLVGTVYQFIGTTTSDYVSGYWYKCTEDTTTTPSTYKWANVDVQDGTISREMTAEEYETLTEEEKMDGTVYYVSDVLPFNPGAATTGFTPIGTVISVMSNHAPTNYLICDGSVYNIVDYPELAAFFQKEFGAPNKFGGDGVTTFAVPDLQGEFLRGSGTNSHDDGGNGSNPGQHQGASGIPGMATWSNESPKKIGMLTIDSQGTDIDRGDKQVKSGAGTIKWLRANIDSEVTTGSTGDLVLLRPTNTSVLFCIAIKNIYVTRVDAANDYSTTETQVGYWLDNKEVYQKVLTGTVPQATTYGTFASNLIDSGTGKSYVRFDGFVIDGDDQMPLPNIGTDLGQQIKMKVNYNDGGLFLLNSYPAWNSFTYYITVQYTKTT